jgi:hypothetical protein
MGVLTDYLIATEAEAQAGAESIPLDSEDRIDLKGIQHVPLSHLHCILTGREWSSGIIDEYQLVHEASEDGPWVYRLPADLVARLAGLKENHFDVFAKAWWATEHFQPLGEMNEGYEIAEVKEYLIALTKLARRAQERGKMLYMWMSL